MKSMIWGVVGLAAGYFVYQALQAGKAVQAVAQTASTAMAGAETGAVYGTLANPITGPLAAVEAIWNWWETPAATDSGN
jgi:hypothetical protein